MRSWIDNALLALEHSRRQWRRGRNLRRAVRTERTRLGAPAWIAMGGALLALAGAALITVHARQLGAEAAPALAGAVLPADALRAALPGATFDVDNTPGLSVHASPSGVLLVVAGLSAAPAVHIDLCRQMPDPAQRRLLPLRIGYQFDDIARMVEHAGATPIALRNIALAGPTDRDMPQLDIGGVASAVASQPLQVSWQSRAPEVRWISDSGDGLIVEGAKGAAALGQEGWLLWGPQSALRLQRRASTACPQAGELLVQRYLRAEDGAAGTDRKALVAAFPAHGAAISTWLAPGRYQIPAAPPAALEDQALFEALQLRGLLRLDADGLIALAPRDLAAWQGAGGEARAADLAGWRGVAMDDAARKLLKRLYRMADGDYVREQVRIFNSERQLLAWRLAATGPQGQWLASVDGVPAATVDGLPAAASRLMAAVPQGWGGWRRVGAWPQAESGAPARLTLTLARPAQRGETLSLMLAGRLKNAQGARAQAICDGRACPSKDALQTVTLELAPGARSVSLDVAPISMAALAAADQRYRHIRQTGNALAWQPLAARQLARQANTAPPAEVTLADRNGVPLWRAGAPSEAAREAGLASMLGLRADHVNSIA
ncbi:MAG: hypothetical protein ABIT83_23350, partial [Massilia sp.]